MEFRLLGPLEVIEADRAVALGAGQQRSLFAMLLLHANQVVSTDRLIDALWGAAPPQSAPKTVQAPNILGDLEPFTVAGKVAVTIGGKTANMEAWKSGNQLWFVFRDLTSADATYPSARFLYTDGPGPDGKVVMDFNRARNPPCAYNQWTTCPLPPAANKLAVRIEAGEKRYHGESSPNAAVLRK